MKSIASSHPEAGTTPDTVPPRRMGSLQGWQDLALALRRRELWLFLGWQDIRQRYRRSVLGPLWLTISTGILVGTLGLLWAKLLNQPIETYLPFFAIGQVTWTLISGCLNEACTGFTQFESIIKQTRLPFSSMLLRLLWRHLIVFAHNFLIILLVVTFAGPGWSVTSLGFVPGLAIVSLFCLFASGPIAVFCTRFRDMPQIVANVLMVLYYLTPILWQPESLRTASWVFELNPLFHLIETVRAPLMGRVATATNFAWAIGATVIAAVAYARMIGRYRDRIAYWL